MAESIFSHLLNGAKIVVDDVNVKGIGPKIGGGLRSAPSGMAFVDVTGRVDADADGIVFEGLPLERPIIPKFLVPKELAGKLSRLVEGDSMEIEKQRRAGNTNIEFNEDKFNNLVASLEKGKNSTSTKPNGMSSRAYNLVAIETDDSTPDMLESLKEKLGDALINHEVSTMDIGTRGQSNVRKMHTFTVSGEKLRNTHAHNFATNRGFMAQIQELPPDGESGMSSRSGSIDWNEPDRDWGDGQGGMVTSWDLPDGGSYTILDYEGESARRFSPTALVRDASGEEVFRKEVSSRNDAMDALKTYHEGRISRGSGMNSSRDAFGHDLSQTKWKGAKLTLADLRGEFDLSGADLTGLDLSDTELVGRNFSYAKLFAVNLSGAKLNRGNFFGADMRMAKLDLANLNNARLDDANLYAASMFGATLIESTLRHARLKNANLREADLYAADVRFANLSNADLSASDLRKANLFGANIDGADFTGADMPEAEGTSFNYMLNADRAVGMSSRSVSQMGMQSLTTRDKRKVDAFVEEAVKEWQRTSGSLARKITSDDPGSTVEDALQNAVLQLLEKIDKEGIGVLDAFNRESEIKQRIKDSIDSGIEDDRIASLLDVSPKDIESVRKFGVPSPAKAWVNRSKKTASVNASREESRQQGKAPSRLIATQRLNNAVWDLIDSGSSDEEIIKSILSNEKLNITKFEQRNLDAIRKTGRVEQIEGVLGVSQGTTSFGVENARRGRAEGDWAASDVADIDVSQDDIPEDYRVDDAIEVADATLADASSSPSEKKAALVSKLREALKDSYDVLEISAERRGSTARAEKINRAEIAQELGISESTVKDHLALIASIRERVENGTFNDPDWLIPFDEIAEAGKTPKGIEDLAEKYNMPITQTTLLARQVSGIQRRMDVKSSATQEALTDFSNQFMDLIKQGYSRGEITTMMPNVNSQPALEKRVALAVRSGLVDERFADKEVLAAIQSIRKKGTGSVSDEMLDKISAMGINIDTLAPVAKKVSEEDVKFEALQTSGKTRSEIMAEMNLSAEQYQRLYSRIQYRNKNN